MMYVYGKISAVLMGLLLASFFAGAVSSSPVEYGNWEVVRVVHGIIRVNSDSELDAIAASEGWAGNGTAYDPYIIEGYNIDAQGAGAAIYIGNVSKIFKITNCTLHNASRISLPYHAGASVLLYNISKDSWEYVEHNELYESDYGIMNTDGGGISIMYNSIHNNTYHGVWLRYAGATSVRHNEIFNNSQYGVYIYEGNSSGILENNITHNLYGVGMSGSSNVHHNIVYGNNISFNSNYGVYIGGSSSYHPNNNSIGFNTMLNDGYGVFIYYGNDNIISDNEIAKSRQHGIDLYMGSFYNIIENNHIHNNFRVGLYIYQYSSSVPSEYNEVKNNNISFNWNEGLYISKASHNTVHNNIFYGNGNYGISISSGATYNTIYNNSFYYNHGSNDTYNSSAVQASDSGSENQWNTSEGGNFWYDWTSPDGDGDGFVDVPYSLDGTANSMDKRPLATDQVIPELSPGILAAAILLGLLIGVARKR